MSIFFRFFALFYLIKLFFERKVLIKGIKHSDLVLDIGSGDKPLWRADVIADRYLKDDKQRFSGPLVYDKRKLFIKADVQNLPFKNKAFDFVFCSHVLEHVENPEKAIQELTRVAKRGYIEVPNAIADLLNPFPPHLWHCFFIKNTLIFKQKEKIKDFIEKNIEQFGAHMLKSSLFQYLRIKNLNVLFIQLNWTNKIRYRVIKAKNTHLRHVYKETPNQKKSFLLQLNYLGYRIYYMIMTTFFYQKKSIRLLKELLKK